MLYAAITDLIINTPFAIETELLYLVCVYVYAV
jgi:hypothetical protein